MLSSRNNHLTNIFHIVRVPWIEMVHSNSSTSLKALDSRLVVNW